MNLKKYPSESVKAITEFLFIEDDIKELKKSDLVLVLCNDNISGICSLINNLFINNIISKKSKIVISGATGSLNKKKEKECIRVKEMLIKDYYFNEEIFILEDKATNIYENLYFINNIIKNFDNYKNILVIGASFALRRIKLCANKLNYPIEKIQFVGAADIIGRNIDKNTWWQNEKSKKRIYEEIERIGKYLVKGDLDIF